MNVTQAALQSGLVKVNGTSELEAAFSRLKASGIGSELGIEGLMAFRESEHILIRLRASNRLERRNVEARREWCPLDRIVWHRGAAWQSQ
jgi:hypothetical protein